MGGCSSRGFRSPLDLVPPFLELVVVAPPISSSTAAAGAAAAIAAATAGSVVGSSADMGGVKAMDRPFVVQAPPVVVGGGRFFIQRPGGHLTDDGQASIRSFSSRAKVRE
jgi:hypothetical protein